MSFSRRQSQWANSALVVNVNPEDTLFTPSQTGRDSAYETVTHTHRMETLQDSDANEQTPLQGIYWQEEMERRAAQMGGGNFVVPVQRVTDFMAATASASTSDPVTTTATEASTVPASAISSSYRLGVREAPLHELYPPFVTNTIRAALLDFEQTMPGFISPGTSELSKTMLF